MEDIKYIFIKIWKLSNNIIYFFLKCLKTKNKITFISRQTDGKNLDFDLIIKEIKDGLLKKDGISHFGHLMGAICGCIFGFYFM